jgi:hypothetical protein
MDKKTRRVLMEALDKFEVKDSPVRAGEIAREILLAHPETKDALALNAVTSMAQNWLRRLARQRDDRQASLLFTEFPQIRSLLPVRGAWVDPDKARLEHWERFEAQLIGQAASTKKRSKDAEQELKSVRKIARIVRWYGHGDIGVTTEDALKRRAEFLQSRKKRRTRNR